MKRFLSTLLSLAIIATIVMIPVSAAGSASASVSAGTVSAKPGEEVLVPINVDFTSIGAMNFDVFYDGDAFTNSGTKENTQLGYTEGPVASGLYLQVNTFSYNKLVNPSAPESKVKAGFIDASGITAKGVLFYLKLNVKSTAAAGDYPITFAVRKAGDEMGNLINASTTDGKVTVSSPATATGIAVKTLPSKTTYKVGESFESTGLVVEQVWSEGENTVINDYTLSNVDKTTPGTKTVTVTQNVTGFTDTFSVTYNNYATGIAIKTNPNKISYNLNEDFDPAGLVVSQKWAYGVNTDITDYTLSTVDKTTIGQKTVTVTQDVTGFTASFNVVYNDYATGISVASLPGKTIYNVGESFDPTGLIINQVWATGSKTTVTDYTLSDVNKNLPGQQTVTVTQTSTGFTTSFDVNYNDVKTGIAVKTLPSKTTYNIGESFVSTGLVVEQKWAYGENTTITDYNLSDINVNVPGTKTITVTQISTGFTAEFNVTYNDVKKGISIKTLPSKTTYNIGESFVSTGLVVEQVWTYGENTVINDFTLSDIDTTTPGTKTVTVTQNVTGFTDTFSVTYNNVKTGISVKTLPNKVTYNIGESFVSTGLVVEQVWAYGENTVINDYTLSDIDTATPGEKTVTVTQTGTGFTTSFNVTYNDIKRGIVVKTNPDKTVYNVGESLDTAGLVIEQTWVYGENTAVTDYYLSDIDINVPGNKLITVTQTSTGFTATFTVKYNDVKEGISVKSVPTKNIYYVGESLDTAGLVVEQIWTYGENTVITDFTVGDIDITTPGTKSVTVTQTSTGFTTSFNVTYNNFAIGISVKTAPDKTVYNVGEQLDSTGLVVEQTWAYGENTVINNYTLSTISTTIPGEKTVTVTQNGTGFTTSFKVTYNNVKKGIVIKTAPNKTVYKVNESFDPAGMVVEQTWVYGNNTVVTDYTVSEIDTTTPGEKTVTVTQDETGFIAQFNVTYNNYATGISVKTLPDKSTYKVGEQFNPAGLVIEQIWAYGENTFITDYTLSPIDDINTPGEKTITVTQDKTGFTAQFNVTYNNYATGIVVKTNPDKVTYNVGEQFEPAGLVIEQIWAYGNNTTVTDYTLSQVDATTPGEKTVTATQDETGFTAQFNVTYNNYTKGIVVKTNPNKVTYNVGEQFDPAGLVIEQIWAYGENTPITDYTLSSIEDINTPGEKTITVTQDKTGFTAQFNVIYTNYATGIVVKTNPDKVTYNVGEQFDPAGLVIEQTWAYGENTPITDYTLSPVDTSTSGEKTVTVTQDGTGFITSFNVTVNETLKIEIADGADVKFSVDTEMGLVKNVRANSGTGTDKATTFGDIRTAFKNSANIKFFDKDGTTELNDTDIVFTNAIVKIFSGDDAVDSKVISVAGDNDGNGSVDAADALRALQLSISKIDIATLTVAEKIAANVDTSSDDVNASDALRILQYSIGKLDDVLN